MTNPDWTTPFNDYATAYAFALGVTLTDEQIQQLWIQYQGLPTIRYVVKYGTPVTTTNAYVDVSIANGATIALPTGYSLIGS